VAGVALAKEVEVEGLILGVELEELLQEDIHVLGNLGLLWT
jgi:hypothetical protein